jgi:hypothetical protein
MMAITGSVQKMARSPAVRLVGSEVIGWDRRPAVNVQPGWVISPLR